MSARDLTFHLDTRNRRLVRDYFSNVEVLSPNFVQGDTYNLRIIAVEPSPLGDPLRPWRYVTLPTSVYVGLGTVGAAPTLGTYTLTFGGDTTAAIAYNATAAQVAAALNLLASITSAGGVSVTGPDGGPYQIVFGSAGAQSALTANADLLYPLSTIQVYEARAGASGIPEIQVIVLDRQPAALAESFAALAAPGITVSTLQGGASGIPEIQKIALGPDVHDGTWTLTFNGATTAALDWDIDAADLQTALEALSTITAGDVTVSGQFPDYILTFGGTLTGNQPACTADATGLVGPVGIEGTLSLNTAGIEQLLDGDASVETKLEISAAISGSPVTLLQIDATVINDQIPNAPQSGTGLPTYYTAAEVDVFLAAIQVGDGPIADADTDAPEDANEAHALNATFDDTEVEAALNTLAAKLNAAAAKYNAAAAKLNAIIATLESNGILTA